MNFEELKAKGKVREWTAEKAKQNGEAFPKSCRIESVIDDLFAVGFTGHFLGVANGALPFYPMLMYSIIRSNFLKNVLEIGIYQGWSSYYLARAASAVGGRYFGIDIEENWCRQVSANLYERDIPHTIIEANTRDIQVGELGIMLNTSTIDFVFIDGEHTSEAALHEIELIYPHLNPNGYGIICMHDVYGSGVDGAWAKLKKDNRFEALVFPHCSGLGILRKIEGLESPEDRAKRCERKTLGCQQGETLEQMEERHRNGDFYTDYVDSEHHDALMKTLHPEMDNFPNFSRVEERAKRYGG